MRYGRLARRRCYYQGGDLPPQFALFRSHQPGVSGGNFMVVAEQVQGTMDEKVRQLFGQAVATSVSLTPCGVGSNDNIPQKVRVQLGECPFTHGESQDVGRTVEAAIVGVEPLHAGVIDDQYAELTILAIESCE